MGGFQTACKQTFNAFDTEFILRAHSFTSSKAGVATLNYSLRLLRQKIAFLYRVLEAFSAFGKFIVPLPEFLILLRFHCQQNINL